MSRIFVVAKISFGLTLLTVSMLFVADFFGIFPDPMVTLQEERTALAEVVAVTLCSETQDGDQTSVIKSANTTLDRHPEILSVCIRRTVGGVFYQSARHARLWDVAREDPTIAMTVEIPIRNGERIWGHVELCFEPLDTGWKYIIQLPAVKLAVFLLLGGGLIYTLYLKRVLRHLDPSAVIPERVKAAFDAMSEGILVLDRDHQIVLANQSFAKATGITETELRGKSASTIPWAKIEGQGDSYPWEIAASTKMSLTGARLRLKDDTEGERTFVVNATPIAGAKGDQRGAMITFDDVTAIEEKNDQLQLALDNLESTRQKVESQNRELKQLAMRDTLTNCLNRRAFYEELEKQWANYDRHEIDLACVMLDVDHFKSINDQHGHQVGDAVLVSISSTIRGSVRSQDVVCRYGGEEFCILLPHTNTQQAAVTAEKIRQHIADSNPGGLKISASFGVCGIDLGSVDRQTLIDRADKALYAAKNGGRNQVATWREEFDSMEEAQSAQAEVQSEPTENTPIPIGAVNALLTALKQRDAATAAHSRRVANLCVMASENLLPPSDCFVLEMAGLLHDIGKIGVPDSILLKPGRLTPAEWKIMSLHDKFGVDIIRSAFGSQELTNIVKHHHAKFGDATDDDSPHGSDIPIRSRILTIADAYDAMVSRRVYRAPLSHQDAFSELRRCAGTQFDPKLVEHFISVIEAREGGESLDFGNDSLEAAVGIGIEAERLAAVIEEGDHEAVSIMAERMLEAAKKFGFHEIATIAADLHSSIGSDLSSEEIVHKTDALLGLCHAVQERVLDGASASSPDPAAVT